MVTKLVHTPAHRIRTCKYCKVYPGLIYPDDTEAQQQQPSGDWKCGKCITEDIQRKIITVDS